MDKRVVKLIPIYMVCIDSNDKTVHINAFHMIKSYCKSLNIDVYPLDHALLF